MREVRGHLAALARDRKGITALEYGIVAGWLAFVVILAFVHIGSQLSSVFTSVSASL